MPSAALRPRTTAGRQTTAARLPCLRCCCAAHAGTDRRTPYRYIDPAANTMRAVAMAVRRGCVCAESVRRRTSHGQTAVGRCAADAATRRASSTSSTAATASTTGAATSSARRAPSASRSTDVADTHFIYTLCRAAAHVIDAARIVCGKVYVTVRRPSVYPFVCFVRQFVCPI